MGRIPESALLKRGQEYDQEGNQKVSLGKGETKDGWGFRHSKIKEKAKESWVRLVWAQHEWNWISLLI
jgi:hypothetical protein